MSEENQVTKAVRQPDTAEFIAMGRRASAEIKRLRAHIDKLQHKAHAYDNITAILGLLPQRNTGVGEDLAWQIDGRIKELTDN